MKIRKLYEKDAPFMLEWMHNPEIVKCLANNFAEMKLSDCIEFIQNSWNDDNNIHLAICNKQDEYLGTVSLKNIDKINGNAEYAIAMRLSALGTGAAQIGTKAILKKAFEDLKLNRVYLNVIEENIRANKFYKKLGFVYEGTFCEHVYIDGKYRNLNWYAIMKNNYK